MSDPALDAALRAYLETWRREQGEGNTIQNLRLEVGQLRVQLEEAIAENKLLKMRIDRHGRRIQAIETHLALEPDDTGQHQVEDLRRALAERERELAERKEEGRWWKRTSVQWIVGGVAWVLMTVFAILATAAKLGK